MIRRTPRHESSGGGGRNDAARDPLWSTFERFGEAYEQHALAGYFNQHYERPCVLEILDGVAGLDALDAACGAGFYAGELVRRGARVAAFDASPAMVDLCRARLAERARVDLASLGGPLPYPSDAFDVIVCALAIQYVDDLGAAFRELHRVLRPRGRLVVSTQHPWRDWQRKGGSYFDAELVVDEWTVAGGKSPVPFWRVPLSQLTEALTDAGLALDRLLEPRPAESMRRRFPAEYEKLLRAPGLLVIRARKLDPVTGSR